MKDERYTLKEALSIKGFTGFLKERNWRMLWIRFKAWPGTILYVLQKGIILNETYRRKDSIRDATKPMSAIEAQIEAKEMLRKGYNNNYIISVLKKTGT